MWVLRLSFKEFSTCSAILLTSEQGSQFCKTILKDALGTAPLVTNRLQQCASRQLLNKVMLVRMEECISRDRPIITGMISSQFCQYSRKAEDFQCSCIIMTKGLTPIRSMCVVPPIQKLWPIIECNPERDHTLLHHSMNQVHDIGTGFPVWGQRSTGGRLDACRWAD